MPPPPTILFGLLAKCLLSSVEVGVGTISPCCIFIHVSKSSSCAISLRALAPSNADWAVLSFLHSTMAATTTTTAFEASADAITIENADVAVAGAFLHGKAVRTK